MAVCRNCGRENDADRDFCENCGGYLRWERTHERAAAPPVESPVEGTAQVASSTRRYTIAPKPPQTPADSVVLTVRLRGDESAVANGLTVHVDPGGEESLVVLIRNQSTIVDNYELEVRGLPDSWCTVTPAAVYLVPFGAAEGGYEQEVELRLRPPRTAEAAAGPWPFAVVARSKALAMEVAVGRATVVLGSYDELADLELRPERSSGRRKADFAIAVRNCGNRSVAVTLAAVDAETATEASFAADRLTAEPGQRVGTEFRVRPRNAILFGQPTERSFEVTVAIVDSDVSAVRKRGSFRQKPWIPRWLPATIALIVVPVLAFLVLMPHKVAVPNLRGRTADGAQKLLAKSGLTLNPKQRPASGRLQVGRVVDQDPAPDAKVRKNAVVTAWFGLGSQTVNVPNVCGMTLAAADAALRRLGLQPVVAQGPAESTNVLLAAEGCQLPVPGQQVNRGTAVTVILKRSSGQPPPASTVGPVNGTSPGLTTTASPGAGTTTVGGPASGGSGGPGKNSLPPVAGLTAAAGVAALVRQGFAYRVVPTISTAAPAGTVLGIGPLTARDLGAGVPVPLLVSAGLPRLVYDAGGKLFGVGPLPGDRPSPIATDLAAAVHEASMNEAGTLVAYRGVVTGASVGRIYVVDTTTGTTTALTNAASDYHRPVFAPSQTNDLLAVVRQPSDGSNRDGDLCFLRLAPGSTARCIADPRWNVTRPAWAPDGKAILLAARSVTDPTAGGLLEYVSVRPFSGVSADWKLKGLVALDGVIFVGWSADGAHIAYSTKTPSGYQLFVAASQNDAVGQAVAVSQTPACELSWRVDGRLALSQYDCANAAEGQIVLVDPAQPAVQTRIAANGANPSWQAVYLGLGR